MADFGGWSDDLKTGNLTIDTQHKQLIKAIQDLLDACKAGKVKETTTRTMKFLAEYTAKHFGDEEKLQQQYGYPDYPRHKTLHDGFKKTVADLQKELEKDGPTISVVAKVNSNVGNWLVTHIKKEDVKVAAHIASKK